ncbi:MAG: glycosyltransferase family 1 protein [Phototrophicaceae bacterium]
MHVAVNGWFWDIPNSGSGQYLRRLMRYLPRVDQTLKISLIMPPHNPKPDNVPDSIEVVTTGNKASSSKLGKVWFEQRTFPKMAKSIGADVAHIPYWGSALSIDIPQVVSVLDVIPLLYPLYSGGFFQRLYVEMVTQSALTADHVITISYTSQIDIEKLIGVAKDRITVTYLATDDAYHPLMGAEKDEAVREKYNLPDNFVLGGLGFDARKQVNELLLAYTYVAPTEGATTPLVLAGKQPDWSNPLFPDLPEYIKRLKLEDYVQWIGYVEEADMPSLYRLADVFAFPSVYEGFGLPPLEAMASGTPTVVWNSIVAEEIYGEGAYFVETARELGAAIISLLLQKPLRDEFVNQGLAQVTHYNWLKTARDTRKVYESVIAKA